MTSRTERFWIKFIIRFGFGFLFLFVSIGQFDAGSPIDRGPTWFAENLSKPFASSWLGAATPDITVEVDGKKVERDPSYYFLLAIPYTFALLSIPILIGVFLRPALRAGALLLVVLGLGKYISSGPDIAGTTNNFVLAFLICIALYFLGQDEQEQASDAGAI